MDLMYDVNKGCDVVKFTPNFEENLVQLHQKISVLASEVQSTERYRRAYEKIQKLSE
jgi:hypothetical protein